MSKSNIIAGSGGGGKSGGGSARVAREAPDSLRSKQYAKVIDLVSEGEIAGLVNGLQSIYLDDTPIQNEDGSFNFSDVVFDSRNGTQAQTFIQGFPSVESEVAVSTQVKYGEPLVRTIASDAYDAARVTVSVPALSRQNTSNGDINGTSVQLQVSVQSDGGGYVPARISTNTITLSNTDGILTSVDQDLISASITVNWTGTADSGGANYYFYRPSGTFQTIAYQLEYRAVGDSTWIPLSSGTFSGSSTWGKVRTSNAGWIQSYRRALIPPTGSRTVQFTAPTDTAYEFRVVKTSGIGTLSPSGSAVTYTSIDTISGKTSGRYQRSYRIPLSGGAPYDIKVERLTADSTSAALQNDTYWDSYTEIVDAKFKYPNSAIMALSLDSEKFSRIPVRGYEIEGMLVQIPSNYDPVERTYDGIWDGTFTTAYSNNPAWCFYDMIVNDRYGLGQFIDASKVDKWSLYEIAQYCDESVADGVGGVEPRFTFNAYIQSQSEAYKLLETMSSAFNAMAYWVGGAVTAVQDSPKDPVGLFTPANVVNGTFNYSGSSAKTRHTVALVRWNDPEDRYRQAIEYVADDEGIARYGVVQKEVSAIGCTSRGQANRFGRAILYAERMETETVAFQTSLDGLSVTVGDVIQTTDPIRAGERMGGRFVSATTTSAVLDDAVTFDGVSTYTLWAIMPDGSVESSTISNSNETTTNISFAELPDTPLANSIWVIGATSLEPETWRVLSVVESDGTNAEITALEYRSDKYSAIEDNLVLEPKKTSSISTVPQTPTDFILDESLYLISKSLVGVRITASWTGDARYYEITYKPEEGNWQTITTDQTSIDIEPVTAGNYEVSIVAVNDLGVRTQPVTKTITVYGLTIQPQDVSGFELQAVAGNAYLTWNKAVDLDVLVGGKIRIRHTPNTTSPTWTGATDIGGEIAGASISATVPLVSGTYLAKFVDSSGNSSDNATIITTNAPNIMSMNFIASLDEAPSYNGTFDYTYNKSGVLTLDSALTIDEMTTNVDDWTYLNLLGGVASSGEYIFDNTIDLGSVQTSRITAELVAEGVDLADLIDLKGYIDEWGELDGAVIDDVDATIYIRESDDAVTFGDWKQLIAGDHTARAFEFKAVLESDNADHNIEVSALTVNVDMPDRTQSGDDIVSGASTYSVEFDSQFYGVPAIGITAQDMQTGDYYTISNKSTTGFDIIFKDSSGTTVSRTFDYIARAY